MLTTSPGADPYFAYKMHHIDRARASWVLAEEFGLFEALRDGPATVDRISVAVGLAPRTTAILLSACSCLGILGCKGDTYFIYDIMRAMVLEGGSARTTPGTPSPDDWSYHSLKAAITSDETPEELIPPWLNNAHETSVDRTAFSPGRHGWRRMWGEALAQAYDFSDCRTVADIGGATGGVLVGLTEKCPHLKGILVELPYSRRTAEAAIKQDGADDRVQFYAADMLTDELPAVDLFFMSHVVHDWSDEICLKLLRRCHEALPDGGVVLVQEYLLDASKSGSLLGVFQWVGLLLGTDGDQRTEPEITALMTAAGFRDCECRPLDHEQSIIIGRK